MKTNMKAVLYGMSIVLFIAYLLSADYIFNVLIRTGEEARFENMQLPENTTDAKFYIDGISRMKLKWKDALQIKGWVFRQDVKSNKRKLLMVLRSKKRTLVYDIKNGMIPRRDVSAVYHLDQNLADHGFEVYIPTYRLKDDSFEIGWIIIDESGKHYVRTNKMLILAGSSALLLDRKPWKAAVPVHLTMKLPGKAISYAFDVVLTSGNYLYFSGWGFINGLGSGGQKAYIVLRKDNRTQVFDTRVRDRKDITVTFSRYGQNLDASGFSSYVPLEGLDDGEYQVGLYLENGHDTGFAWSERRVKVRS